MYKVYLKYYLVLGIVKYPAGRKFHRNLSFVISQLTNSLNLNLVHHFYLISTAYEYDSLYIYSQKSKSANVKFCEFD